MNLVHIHTVPEGTNVTFGQTYQESCPLETSLRGASVSPAYKASLPGVCRAAQAVLGVGE